MRKRIMRSGQQAAPIPEGEWLNLEHLAEVEITSEHPDYPIESALQPAASPGWRAAAPGEQTIRLVFDAPQRLRRISLRFDEPRVERTQEFVLRWSTEGERSFREIVRQRWNFSPQGATREAEEYAVDLAAVAVLELTILPDVSGGDAVASLTQWRLA